jgi:hypothetical protein
MFTKKLTISVIVHDVFGKAMTRKQALYCDAVTYTMPAGKTGTATTTVCGIIQGCDMRCTATAIARVHWRKLRNTSTVSFHMSRTRCAAIQMITVTVLLLACVTDTTIHQAAVRLRS